MEDLSELLPIALGLDPSKCPGFDCSLLADSFEAENSGLHKALLFEVADICVALVSLSSADTFVKDVADDAVEEEELDKMFSDGVEFELDPAEAGVSALASPEFPEAFFFSFCKFLTGGTKRITIFILITQRYCLFIIHQEGGRGIL